MFPNRLNLKAYYLCPDKVHLHAGETMVQEDEKLALLHNTDLIAGGQAPPARSSYVKS